MTDRVDLADLHERPTVLLPERTLLHDGIRTGQGVLVADGRVAEVGEADVVQERHPGAAVVRLPRRLLMPGLVDAHHHLTQSFGKSLVFGEPSEIFRRVWVPMEAHLDEEAIDVATRLAAWESLRGGFTTVADAGTRATVDGGVERLAEAAGAVGVRCVLGTICNDLVGGERVAEVDDVLAAAGEHLHKWEGHDLVQPSLAVSIPEVASDEMLTRVTALAREAGVTFQTHLNEHLAAVERSLEATGMRPLERLAHLGALGPELLAAHTTLLTPREITLLRDSGGAISYNPVASAWKGNAVAPALLMHELGVRVGLGTDGTRGDAFRMLDAAETAQRLVHGLPSGDSSVGGGWTWLERGLTGGADAVGLAGQIGEISAGAHADLLVLTLDVPELVPSWDLPWELVRLAGRDQIESVVVGGRLRVRDGRPLGVDGDALLDRAREIAERAVERAPIHKIHPFSADHRASGQVAHA
ncbi:amidohydrolase family protein [Georgenia sp. Z1344]|uniref:amidohydrolase family protein n=1 Tax=Georgenia sp. Z1344 TaxID=3416706 RepID=UPI003CF92B9E